MERNSIIYWLHAGLNVCVIPVFQPYRQYIEQKLFEICSIIFTVVAIVYKPYTLSIIMKPCHEVELKIAQASEGCDVQLEFHEWQDKYMTVPTLGLVYITHPFMYVISACSSIL